MADEAVGSKSAIQLPNIDFMANEAVGNRSAVQLPTLSFAGQSPVTVLLDPCANISKIPVLGLFMGAHGSNHCGALPAATSKVAMANTPGNARSKAKKVTVRRFAALIRKSTKPHMSSTRDALSEAVCAKGRSLE